MLDEHLMLPERRKAQDGYLYTAEEFRDYYGEDSARWWEAAARPEEYKWESGDLNNILGRALWPRPRILLRSPLSHLYSPGRAAASHQRALSSP